MELWAYSQYVKQCEGFSDFWACACAAWPVWKEIRPSVRGHETNFFKLLCHCAGASGANSPADAVVIPSVFPGEVGIYLARIWGCNAIADICCMSSHYERLQDLIDKYGEGNVEMLILYMCCSYLRQNPPLTTPPPAQPPVIVVNPQAPQPPPANELAACIEAFPAIPEYR